MASGTMKPNCPLLEKCILTKPIEGAPFIRDGDRHDYFCTGRWNLCATYIVESKVKKLYG